MGTGVVCILLLAFLHNIQKAQHPLSALDTLQSRPFTSAHALPVLMLTGLFALMAAFHAPDAKKGITPASLILGSGILVGAGLLTATLCTTAARKGFRAAFGSAACTWQNAIGKGVLYGFAAIPLVSLVSLAVAETGDKLGLDMRSQEVFTWLDDPSVPVSVRAGLVLFAVVGAPVSEELLFRGILLPALAKGRAFAFAVLLSSFYFALIHLHGPSFLSLMLLSAMFSAGYAATGSILTPVIMHAVFNITGVLFFFSSGQ